MKSIQMLAAGILLLFAGAAQSQVSVNLHIGSPPPWGPEGYSGVRYYYLPDVQAYYDVQSSMFIYNSGNGWIRRSALPGRYRNYDLYGGYKVVLSDYHGNTPYRQFNEHRAKYGRGYHGNAQRTIGERPNRGIMGPNRAHENKQNNHGIGKSNGKHQVREHGNGGERGKNR
jgi:hypothetical protein